LLASMSFRIALRWPAAMDMTPRGTLHRLDLACCDLAGEYAGRRAESARLNA